MRRGTRRSARDTGSRRRGSRRRSVRSAYAAKGKRRPGGEVRRGAAQGHAPTQQDRAHRPLRQGQRADLTPRSSMVTIERITVTPFVIPTATPEADGTLEWDKTTLVLVEASAGGVAGVGYTYADTSTAVLVKDLLAGV